MPRRPASNAAVITRAHPTIGDVASMAGVARPTVSAVLNNRADCYASEKTRQRVRDAAERLGYEASPFGRALRGKQTAMLGLVVGGFDTEPTTIKFFGFEAAARDAGKVTVMVSTEGDSQREDQAIRWLMHRYVDGIAVYPTERGPHHELKRLVDRGFPVVTIDGYGRLGFDADDVSIDVVACGRAQAQHLIELGRQHVCLLTNTERCYVNDRKVEGFLAAFADAGLTTPEQIALPMPRQGMYKWVIDEFEQITGLIRERAARCDAIATLGDMVALAVIRCATELGLRVPEDLAVIGMDGLTASAQGAIPLSTITHDAAASGRAAFEMLNERLGGKLSSGAHRRVTLPGHLIARASTIGRLQPPTKPAPRRSALWAQR